MKKKISSLLVLSLLAVAVIGGLLSINIHKAIAAPLPGTCIVLNSNLGVGRSDINTGGEVTKLQNFLMSSGYLTLPPGTSPGYFGNLTKSAVQNFQAANGIERTGFVGQLTRAKTISLACGGSGQSQGNTANAPSVIASALNVTNDSHVVVMEFEPWFGPNAIPFNAGGNTVLPLPPLVSANMVNHGGGYDSADPVVTREQMKMIQNLGADALLVDLTNWVDCIFSAAFCPGSDPQHTYNTGSAALKANITALYSKLSELNRNGNSNMKIIPLIGAQNDVWETPGADDNFQLHSFPGLCNNCTAVEAATQFFLNLQQQYPELTVNYKGKPLMVYFHGAAQGNRNQPMEANGAQLSPCPWWQRLEILMDHDQTQSGCQAVSSSHYGNQVTYVHMGGFFDDQCHHRTSCGAVSPIRQGNNQPSTGFWTWVDRYNPAVDYYPSYNLAPNGSTVEAFTAVVATAGRSGGYGTPPNNYAPDATLNNHGEAFQRYMHQAKDVLRPTFLMVQQWNEYVGDQGFDDNTRNDIEPNTVTGMGNYNFVKTAITNYKTSLGIPLTPFIDNPTPISATLSPNCTPTSCPPVNGTITVSVGDTINHSWSSTGGVSYSSSYTSVNNATGASCGAGPWVANNAAGSSNGNVVDANGANCTFTILYNVTGASGQTVTATLIIRINPLTPPANAPHVESITPSSASIGTQITVRGSEFTPTQNRVRFGVGTFGVASSNGTELRFSVPSHLQTCNEAGTSCTNGYTNVTPGVYQVYIINSNGTSNQIPFTVTTPPPSGPPHISSISPTSGPAGMQVKVYGTGLSNQANSVNFGPGRISPYSGGSKVLAFRVPTAVGPCGDNNPGCTAPITQIIPGTYQVSVTNSNGTSNTVNFTVAYDEHIDNPPPSEVSNTKANQSASAFNALNSLMTQGLYNQTAAVNHAINQMLLNLKSIWGGV